MRAEYSTPDTSVLKCTGVNVICASKSAESPFLTGGFNWEDQL